jgi:hypothetical protein
MQCYTVYFIWKLLYMFRVVSPPINRSANNCIYNIWYLSHRYSVTGGRNAEKLHKVSHFHKHKLPLLFTTNTQTVSLDHTCV